MHERREKELSRRGQFSSSIARTRNLGGIDHGDLEVLDVVAAALSVDGAPDAAAAAATAVGVEVK